MALARRWLLYDLPAPLKIHQRPIPRIGGVAMMAGLVAGAFVADPSFLQAHGSPALAVALVWGASLADDVKDLAPLARLAVHFVAGSLFWFGGLRLIWTRFVAADFLLTCFFVAFVVNSMNLLDGMDGIAAGTAAVAGIGFLPLFGGASGSFPRGVALALLGVCGAFLIFNFPPARVFMGDSGSTLLGVVFAFLMLESVRTQTSPLRLAPVAIFLGLPLMDALLAIVRRFQARSSPFEGDRAHFYDLLLCRGWSVRRILVWSYGTTAVLVLAGWSALRAPMAAPYEAVLVVAVLASGTHLLDSRRSKRKPDEVVPQSASIPRAWNELGQ
jgi:UDP-GlcNAc:undecaprenyl-phosphate/decaprenyl-phosphate GlcNAc-1-phosphate transferase